MSESPKTVELNFAGLDPEAMLIYLQDLGYRVYPPLPGVKEVLEKEFMHDRITRIMKEQNISYNGARKVALIEVDLEARIHKYTSDITDNEKHWGPDVS